MTNIVEIIARVVASEPYADKHASLVSQKIVKGLHDAGYAIVPVEPTEAMLELGLFEAECCTDDWTAAAACLPKHVYRTMINAARTGVQ